MAIVALWWGSVATGIFAAYQLPPPPVVIDAAVGLWGRGLLQRDLLTTIGRVALGFAIGSSAAIGLGILTGLSRRVSEAVEPTLQALRTVPTLAWAPLLLLWLGIDEPPKVTLVAIGAFFPVYVNLVAGIHNVDRKLIEVARVYDLSPRAVALRVVIPASLPSLMTGLRLGLSQSWLFIVVAEFFGASAGLGFRLTDSQQSSRVDLMFVALISLAILGKVTDMLLYAVEDRTLRWRDTLATQARL
ncbi:MAG TPA: ABC transporter permease [Candidatus Limnocylindria bacterium]